jgi:hypothetical protein
MPAWAYLTGPQDDVGHEIEGTLENSSVSPVLEGIVVALPQIPVHITAAPPVRSLLLLLNRPATCFLDVLAPPALILTCLTTYSQALLEYSPLGVDSMNHRLNRQSHPPMRCPTTPLLRNTSVLSPHGT